MTDEKNATKAVAQSIRKSEARSEKKERASENGIVTVSSGVKFRVKEVPQMVYVDLRNSLPEPSPPIFYNPEYDREEPNENDPRYLIAKSNWESAMSTGIVDITLLFGSEIVSIPKNVPTPDSEEFRDKLNVFLRTAGWDKTEIRNISKSERYLYWVKYEACKQDLREDNSDLSVLMNEIGRVAGVPEEDVHEAIEKFRD